MSRDRSQRSHEKAVNEGGDSVHASRRVFLRTMLLAAPAACLGTELIAAGSRAIEPDPALAAALLAERIMYRPRAAWATGTPERHRLRRMSAYRRITVHHAGNGIDLQTSEADIARTLDGIRGAHLRRRYGDIGYHYAVDREGRIWEGRPLDLVGAHVLGCNEDNIGIMLLGNFEKQRPSDLQLGAVHAAVSTLKAHFRVPAASIYGHRDLGHTLCPGRYLYAYLEEIRGA